MQNLSCENDFLLNSFSQERFCTWPRFKSEGFWNSEMAYKMTIMMMMIIILMLLVMIVTMTINTGLSQIISSPVEA